MKILIPALIILLSVSTVYFYLQTQHLKQIHDLALANMQVKLEKSKNECQTKIARVRSYYETQLAEQKHSTSQSGMGNILDVLGNIKEKARQNREANIVRSKRKLDMDEATFSAFTQVMDQYEANKKKVLQLAKDEQKPFFDQRYLNMLSQYQKKAMTDLKKLFTPEQMKSFQDLGLDKDLGLTAQ